MKKITVFLLGLIITFAGYTQKTSFGSPYSAFGIGDIQAQTTGMQQAMGNIGVGFSDRLEANWVNPAGTAAVRRAVFHMALHGNGYQFQSSSNKIPQNDFNVSYIGLTLPVAKHGTFSAVVLPYSSNSYNIRNEIYDSTNQFSYRELYTGVGGINKVQAQYSHSFANRLNIGMAGSYLFGPLYREQYVIFPDTSGAMNLRLTDQYKVSDFGFTGGLQYKLFWGDSSWRKLSKDVNSFHTTTIGFNYNVGRALATSREYLSIRYLTVNGATQIVDTTSLKFSKKDSSGTIGIPASMGFGLAFEDFRHWMIAGDFVWYDWSKANFFNQSSVYGTSFGMHLGGYYLPDGFKGETFWERTTYRAGFRYFQTGMQIKSTPINEWAFSLGLTLPNKQRNNPLSGYTIAIELGQRGTIKNDLIRDNFMKVTLAFNLTDRFPWFIQSKYD